jgi:hypothetical protein
MSDEKPQPKVDTEPQAQAGFNVDGGSKTAQGRITGPASHVLAAVIVFLVVAGVSAVVWFQTRQSSQSIRGADAGPKSSIIIEQKQSDGGAPAAQKVFNLITDEGSTITINQRSDTGGGAP